MDLIVYRALLLPVVVAVALFGGLWRAITGRESMADLRERLGHGKAPDSPQVWLHGASIGELGSAKTLLLALIARQPDARFLITSNTVTGRAMVQSWNLNRVSARLAPLDTRSAHARFLRRENVICYIQIENELWPNRFLKLAARAVPIIIASARMSRRSFERWMRLPGLARRTLGVVSLVAAQDAESESRLLQLGLDPARIRPLLNLKAVSTAPPVDQGLLSSLQSAFPRAATVLAAQTHPGEDRIVIQAFAVLRATYPDLRLIVAPRHPERGDEIVRLIANARLTVARRSVGDDPQGAPIYLADTLGEMGLWYTLSQLTLVGGSLADHGGHTPYEPVACGSVVVHGPHVSNFLQAYRALDAAGAARAASAETLAATLAELIADPSRTAKMAATARLTLGTSEDALSPFIDTILPSIQTRN